MPSASTINGNTNGAHHSDPLPVTKSFAAFVAETRTEQLTPQIRQKLKEVIIDYIGVIVGALDNADSSKPIYNAVLSLQGHGNSGSCTVLGMGTPHMLPQYAAMVNSALGHSMDFDDTYAEGTLHAGVTAISASLTQAELLGDKVSSEDVMLAISIGYEVTCRLGRELGYEAYSRGFHNTGTAGVFGAVAAIASLKRLSADVVEMAFGIAGSKAAGSMQYLDNGSWNKRLHPGFAVHDAFMSVALAEAGVIGATRSIEGKSGMLHAYSPSQNQDLQRLVDGLGSKWVWLESSLKPYPACRMTHGFIEMAGNLRGKQTKTATADRIRAIVLTMSPANFQLVGDPTPNKIHPENVIDAQFSAYFQVANALLYGSATGLDAYKKLSDASINAVSEKIEVNVDKGMTHFSSRIEVQWADGHQDKVFQQYPLGEAQHPFTRDKVDKKFLSLSVPVYGEEKANRIIGLVDSIEQHNIQELMALLQ